MVLTRKIVFISMVVMLTFSGMTVIFPLLPFYFEDFGGGPTQYGYAASAFALAVFLISPTMGRLADKYGKVKVIWTNLVGYGLVNFGFIFVQSYWDIIILRFFEGFFTAGVAPAAISIASDLSSEEDRARSIAFVTAGISTGIIIGPVLGGFLVEYYPIYFPFIISGCLGLIGAITAKLILTEPSKPESSGNERSKGLKAIMDYAPKPLTSFVFLLVFIFLSQIVWLFIEPGFVYYFYEELHLSPVQFGIHISVFGAGVLFGELVLGGISDRFGRIRIMVIGSFVYAVFFYALVYAKSFQAIVIAGGVAGLAFGLIGPASNALLSEVSLEEHRTFIFGLATSAAGVAQIIGPIAGGYAIDRGLHVTVLMKINVLILLIAILILIFVKFDRYKTRQDPLLEQEIQVQIEN